MRPSLDLRTRTLKHRRITAEAYVGKGITNLLFVEDDKAIQKLLSIFLESWSIDLGLRGQNYFLYKLVLTCNHQLIT